MPAFTYARAIDNLWNICLCVNILSLEWLRFKMPAPLDFIQNILLSKASRIFSLPSKKLRKFSRTISFSRFFSWLLGPVGQLDVQWTSIEHQYRTCGRPKQTFNWLLVDAPNETQLVRANRTKMDVHFRPSRDTMHGTWTSSGTLPDVH